MLKFKSLDLGLRVYVLGCRWYGSGVRVAL